MPASSFLRVTERSRFWLFILLLQFLALPSIAAEKRLDPVLAPMARQGRAGLLGRLPGTNHLRLTFSLPLRHAGELTNLLAAIYNPASPDYHHYLTPAEFAARFGPTRADYAAMLNFANTNGLTVTALDPMRLRMNVDGSVVDIERALHVTLHSYGQATGAGNFFAPDQAPTVDARLPLLHVSGLQNFYRPHPNVIVRSSTPSAHKSPNGGSSPYGTYIGNDFRQAYVPGTELTGAGQNVALLEFDDFFTSDITNYENTIGLTNNAPQITVIPVDGGVSSPGVGSVEVALDIEMVLAMSPGVSNIYVYEAPNLSPWDDILGQMANDNLAAQLSSSWSGGPPDPAGEQIFLQMAAQGQTFFNAAGDTGAFTNVVDFPSSSPNVIQVGGTYLVTQTNGDYSGEVVWNRGDGLASSGGIGISVGMPAWQTGVDMTTNGGSTIWREIPDVALTAENVCVIADGETNVAAGTSCAAPLWAALTALVNQQSAQLGQPPVGFLNPAIYSICRGTNYAATFHDITTGNNTNLLSTNSFFATPGYDLCTGWGTPAGTNLINELTTPDYLGIWPATAFYVSGLAGTPLSQTNWSITLTNAGPGSIDWSIGALPEWLTVSALSGTLTASDSTNLDIELVNPGTFSVGSYSAVISVTNLELSRVQSVSVRVDVSQSLVENGGFETGDFTGWTLVGDTVNGHTVYNEVGTDADYPGLVHSGSFGAFLGENGYMAELSQPLATQPGQSYLVSFWLDNAQPGSVEQFNAIWNGTNLLSLSDPPTFTWSNFQYVATAADTSTVLEFDAENDPAYFGLDDVAVIPLPPVEFAGYSECTNTFQLSWPSVAGVNYSVQSTTNLASGCWYDLGIVVASTNITTFVDTNSYRDCPQRFYRLVLHP